MVSPVYGPLSKLTVTDQNYDYSVGYRQTRPYTLVLPYERRISTYNDSLSGTVSTNLAWNFIDETGAWDSWIPLTNHAYEKMIAKLRDSAQLGAAIAEFSQAAGMVAARATQLASAWRYLKRGNFAGFLHSLAVDNAPKKGTSKRKHASNIWLEYHFGWSPMVSDIYSAVDVFQNPLKNQWPRGRSGDSYTKDIELPTGGSNPSAIYPYPTSWRSHKRWKYERRVQMGCKAYVENPNLWLANQLGLINPAAVAWELVPFSFVVDWFGNVGQVINSMTDLLGLAVSDGYTTYSVKGSLDQESAQTVRWFENGGYTTSSTYFSASGTFAHTRRLTGITLPRLAMSASVPGWKRMLTSYALFTQIFGK